MAQQSDQFGVARRTMLHGASIGSALALFGGIGAARAATDAPFPDHPRWKLVFVNHVTTNPFFVPTQYGIQDACGLLGCDYQWTGSANADVARDGERDERRDCRQGGRDRGADRRSHTPSTHRCSARWTPAFRCSPTMPTRPPAAATSASPISARTSTSPATRWASASLRMIDSGLVALFIATPGQLNIQPRLDGASRRHQEVRQEDRHPDRSPPARR